MAETPKPAGSNRFREALVIVDPGASNGITLFSQYHCSSTR